MVELIVAIFAGLGFCYSVHFIIGLIVKLDKNAKKKYNQKIKVMKNKIYAIRNPIWLADTFIFTKVVREDCFGKMQTYYPYITINSINKIDEIGVDITIRMCCMFHKMEIGPILDKSSEATKTQKSIYRRIDKNLWGALISREQLKHI